MTKMKHFTVAQPFFLAKVVAKPSSQKHNFIQWAISLVLLDFFNRTIHIKTKSVKIIFIMNL